MKRTAAVMACGVLALATACGGGGGGNDAKGKPQRPKTREVTVVIVDPTPLEIYFNDDDTQCTAQSIADSISGEAHKAPTVVVKNDSGKIVGTATAPMSGGTFTKGQGCRVVLPAMTVPRSSFYEVTVSGGVSDELTRTATGKDTDGTISINVSF